MYSSKEEKDILPGEGLNLTKTAWEKLQVKRGGGSCAEGDRKEKGDSKEEGGKKTSLFKKRKGALAEKIHATPADKKGKSGRKLGENRGNGGEGKALRKKKKGGCFLQAKRASQKGNDIRAQLKRAGNEKAGRRSREGNKRGREDIAVCIWRKRDLL